MKDHRMEHIQFVHNRRAVTEHWNSKYTEDSRIEKQIKNESRYSVVIKLILDEIDNRQLNHRITNSELKSLISKLFESSKFLSERFER